MGFYNYNEDGSIRRHRVAIVTGESSLVEQSHKAEVDINNIVKKHGADLIAQVAALREWASGS